jgi:uncharacterized protein YraI
MQSWKIVAAATISLLGFSGAASSFEAAVNGHLSLRAGPGVGHARLFVMPANTRVFVHGCTANRHWCQVSYGAMTGWASGGYLSAVPQQAYAAVPQTIIAQPQVVVGATQMVAPMVAVPAPVYQPQVVLNGVPVHGVPVPGLSVHGVPVHTHVNTFSHSHPGRVVAHRQVVTTYAVPTAVPVHSGFIPFGHGMVQYVHP